MADVGQELVLGAVGRFGRLFCLPQLGDFRACPKPFDDVAARVADRCSARLEPAIFSVVAADAVFHVVGTGAIHRLQPKDPRRLAIVGVQRFHPAPAQQIRLRNAGVLRPLAAEIVARAVGRCGPNKLRQGLRQAPPALLGFAQTRPVQGFSHRADESAGQHEQHHAVNLSRRLGRKRVEGRDEQIIGGRDTEQCRRESRPPAAQIGAEDDRRDEGHQRLVVAEKRFQRPAQHHREASGEHGHAVGDQLLAGCIAHRDLRACFAGWTDRPATATILYRRNNLRLNGDPYQCRACCSSTTIRT